MRGAAAVAARPRLWPAALATLIALAVLVSLGTWQLRRLAWKEDLIARIAARAAAPPVTLAEALARADDKPGLEFTRVQLRGRFRHGAEMHVFATTRDGTGYLVVTPLATEAWLVPVVRGAVPAALKDPASRAQGQIEGEVDIVGRVRWSESRNAFTPPPDPQRNIWFMRDLGEMRSRLAAAGPNLEVAPFFIEQEGDPAPGGWPRPSPAAPNLPNNHLGYALTWYGLALTLVGVFTAWAWTRRRR